VLILLNYTPDVDGETKFLGIIGCGIKYTWSPRIHNSSAQTLGINNIYLPFDMPQNQLSKFLELAWDLGAVGFNVTTPHKVNVAAILKSQKQSINTLFRGESEWQTESTDGFGFVKGLQRIQCNIEGIEKMVVLGNGGLVVAILEHLKAFLVHMPEIVVVRRNPTKDHSLKNIHKEIKFVEFEASALKSELDSSRKETLLVQCTSAPLLGDSLAELTPALDNFKGFVCDTVYGKPSAVYSKAIALNLKAQDGESMLIEQARKSQMIWWGRCDKYDNISRAIRGK